MLDRGEIGLWAVADGMGGHSRGDWASEQVVRHLSEVPAPDSAQQLLRDVRAAIQAAHDEIRAAAQGNDGEGVIGCTTVALMIFSGHFARLWAGDSRLYRLRDGRLEQFSRDHSRVQELIDDDAIAACLAGAPPAAAADALIGQALDRGGRCRRDHPHRGTRAATGRIAVTRRRFCLLLGLAGLGVMVTGPAGADYQRGMDAYDRGDVQTAVSEWAAGAQAGDPQSEYRLRRLYDLGIGVPRDLVDADVWYMRPRRTTFPSMSGISGGGLAMPHGITKWQRIQPNMSLGKPDQKERQNLLPSMACRFASSLGHRIFPAGTAWPGERG